jgi:hypothetical protein
VVAASLGELGSAQRRLDDAIARLAAGKTVDSSALCGAMPLVAYKARYGDDWPR